MITGVEMRNLRGIREGSLKPLTLMNVLTGPNGCGKSTLLEGLLILCDHDPAAAIAKVVARRRGVLNGAWWLFGSHEQPVLLHCWPAPPETAWMRKLTWSSRSPAHLDKELRQRFVDSQTAKPPYSSIEVERAVATGKIRSEPIAFGVDNVSASGLSGGGLSPVDATRLVDPALPEPLHQAYSSIARSPQQRAQVEKLLGDLVPGFRTLEILAEDDTPILHVRTESNSVPVALAGDGIQAFVQLALKIALPKSSLVLIEEPEVYQHPRAIRQTARALWTNARRGVQTVLTTHSLELIDALIAEAGDRIDDLAVFNLSLEDGLLRSGVRAGEEVRFAREELENDLR